MRLAVLALAGSALSFVAQDPSLHNCAKEWRVSGKCATAHDLMKRVATATGGYPDEVLEAKTRCEYLARDQSGYRDTADLKNCERVSFAARELKDKQCRSGTDQKQADNQQHSDDCKAKVDKCFRENAWNRAENMTDMLQKCLKRPQAAPKEESITRPGSGQLLSLWSPPVAQGPGHSVGAGGSTDSEEGQDQDRLIAETQCKQLAPPLKHKASDTDMENCVASFFASTLINQERCETLGRDLDTCRGNLITCFEMYAWNNKDDAKRKLEHCMDNAGFVASGSMDQEQELPDAKDQLRKDRNGEALRDNPVITSCDAAALADGRDPSACMTNHVATPPVDVLEVEADLSPKPCDKIASPDQYRTVCLDFHEAAKTTFQDICENQTNRTVLEACAMVLKKCMVEKWPAAKMRLNEVKVSESSLKMCLTQNVTLELMLLVPESKIDFSPAADRKPEESAPTRPETTTHLDMCAGNDASGLAWQGYYETCDLAVGQCHKDAMGPTMIRLCAAQLVGSMVEDEGLHPRQLTGHDVPMLAGPLCRGRAMSQTACERSLSECANGLERDKQTCTLPRLDECVSRRDHVHVLVQGCLAAPEGVAKPELCGKSVDFCVDRIADRALYSVNYTVLSPSVVSYMALLPPSQDKQHRPDVQNDIDKEKKTEALAVVTGPDHKHGKENEVPKVEDKKEFGRLDMDTKPRVTTVIGGGVDRVPFSPGPVGGNDDPMKTDRNQNHAFGVVPGPSVDEKKQDEAEFLPVGRDKADRNQNKAPVVVPDPGPDVDRKQKSKQDGPFMPQEGPVRAQSKQDKAPVVVPDPGHDVERKQKSKQDGPFMPQEGPVRAQSKQDKAPVVVPDPGPDVDRKQKSKQDGPFMPQEGPIRAQSAQDKAVSPIVDNADRKDKAPPAVPPVGPDGADQNHKVPAGLIPHPNNDRGKQHKAPTVIPGPTNANLEQEGVPTGHGTEYNKPPPLARLPSECAGSCRSAGDKECVPLCGDFLKSELNPTRPNDPSVASASRSILPGPVPPDCATRCNSVDKANWCVNSCCRYVLIIQSVVTDPSPPIPSDETVVCASADCMPRHLNTGVAARPQAVDADHEPLPAVPKDEGEKKSTADQHGHHAGHESVSTPPRPSRGEVDKTPSTFAKEGARRKSSCIPKGLLRRSS